MRILDESWARSFEASKEEARTLGAGVRGSEHLLLGVLRVGGRTVERLKLVEPRLNIEEIREAAWDAIDDLPYLEDLGVDIDLMRRLTEREGPESLKTTPPPTTRLREGATAELVTALNEANGKYWFLVEQKRLPDPGLVSSDLLLLTVLEPGCRAYKLLLALGTQPEWLRELVLESMASGERTPKWPSIVPRSRFTRAVDRFMEWLNAENDI